jgi:acyl carrier protein
MIKLNKNKISSILKKKIDLNKSFEENNIDSLDRLIIVDYLMKEYKMNISQKKMHNAKNFKDLF